MHPIKEIVEMQKKGKAKGIYSACSANEYVIEAVMENAKNRGGHALIEATANQVNQYGGYTGMNAFDFKKYVFSIAERLGFPKDKIILGGDHLGPLTWKEEQAAGAMEKSKVLIREYVLAGFTKIHIDISMHLLGDNLQQPLENEVIAERGAILCGTAEEAFAELRETEAEAMPPVYVVGSEVPIPGGSQEEETLTVTKAEDFENTVEAFQKAFLRHGLEKAWEKVVAIVVQPGVEFGDDAIHEYDREAAAGLSRALKKYPNLVFEGHSTDYQTAKALRQMVEDGIAILKVGPALTFALREGLFALNYMENELFRFNSDIQLSNFIDTLENVMAKSPGNWKKHYHGTESKIRFAMRYSFSDRSRYYLPVKEVSEAVDRMIGNLKSTPIPLTLISEFMPVQYVKIRNGLLKNDPISLLKDRVTQCIEDYLDATEG